MKQRIETCPFCGRPITNITGKPAAYHCLGIHTCIQRQEFTREAELRDSDEREADYAEAREPADQLLHEWRTAR